MFNFLKDIVSDSLGFYMGPGKALTFGLVVTGIYCYYPMSLSNSFTALINHLDSVRCINQLEGYQELYAILNAYSSSTIQLWPQIISFPTKLNYLTGIFTDEAGATVHSITINSLDDLELKKSLIQAQIDLLEEKLKAIDLKRLDIMEKTVSEQKTYISKKTSFWYLCAGLAVAVLTYFTGVELGNLLSNKKEKD